MRIFFAFCVIAPCSLIYLLLCLVLLPWRVLRIIAGNVFGLVMSATVLRMAGIRLVISNKERLLQCAPALYICNHTSTVEMWAGMVISPPRCCGVAKKEIARLPFFGQAYLLSGHILVDRSNRQKAIASMNHVGQIVRKHRLSLWMWPEGHRSRDGRLQPLKKGFVHLAIATGLPVVPVVFHEAHLRWPANTMKTNPGALRVEVLEPIDTTGWRQEDAERHCLDLWSTFQQALGPAQQALSPPDEAGP